MALNHVCLVRMINNICSHKPRTEIIIQYVKKYKQEGRDILILSDRREHLQYIRYTSTHRFRILCRWYETTRINIPNETSYFRYILNGE